MIISFKSKNALNNKGSPTFHVSGVELNSCKRKLFRIINVEHILNNKCWKFSEYQVLTIFRLRSVETISLLYQYHVVWHFVKYILAYT